MKVHLNREDLEDFIKYKMNKSRLDPKSNSTKCIYNSEEWLDEIIGINYFLSKVCEKRYYSNKEAVKVVKEYYKFNESMWFTTEEFDYKFIDLLMKKLPDPDLNLEDNLMLVYSDYLNFDYS